MSNTYLKQLDRLPLPSREAVYNMTLPDLARQITALMSAGAFGMGINEATRANRQARLQLMLDEARQREDAGILT